MEWQVDGFSQICGRIRFQAGRGNSHNIERKRSAVIRQAAANTKILVTTSWDAKDKPIRTNDSTVQKTWRQSKTTPIPPRSHRAFCELERMRRYAYDKKLARLALKRPPQSQRKGIR